MDPTRVGIAALALCAATVAGCGSNTKQASKRPVTAAAPTTRPATISDAALRAAFPVLARPATDADKLPHRLRSFNSNERKIRLARRLPGGAFLLIASSQLCLDTPGEGGGAICDLASHAAQNAVFVTRDCQPSPSGPRFTIYGLLPAGASDPVVVLASGRRPVTLQHGTFRLDVAHGTTDFPERLEWSAGSAKKRQLVPASDDAAKQPCPAS